MSALGKRLKELRGDLSQSKLVKDFEEQTNTTLTAQSLGRYESETRKPDSEMLTALARYYGVSADYLLGLSDVKEINANKKSVCEYTGLSSKSVELLSNVKEKQVINLINYILEEYAEDNNSSIISRIIEFLSIDTFASNQRKAHQQLHEGSRHLYRHYENEEVAEVAEIPSACDGLAPRLQVGSG